MNRTGSLHRAKHLGRRRGRGGRRAAPTSRERRAVARLVVCGGIFVLLVLVKLLFPQTVARLSQTAGELIGQDADFKAAFAAMGRAISGEAAVSDSLQDAYTAVFSPGAEIPAPELIPEEETEEAKPVDSVPLPSPEEPVEAVTIHPLAQEKTEDDVTTTEAVSYVYTMAPPPENASLEQRNLGFDHVSPVQGRFSSGFGWREHPIDGETRFHYGLDLAANTGESVLAFADGEVYATGESSTLGNYIMVRHQGGYMTLYAHCDRVTATGGAVAMGEKIAEVGSSGMATGPHLHFELQDGGLYLNPIYYVELG